MTTMARAYSFLEIKSIDENQRSFTGIATTPTTDRMDDIVESQGAQFQLPLPFLWQHDSRQPIGHVIAANPTTKGIPVTVQLVKVDELGTLKDRLDEAWQSIKYKLVRGLSIGFKPIETADIEGTWGSRFMKWEWLELSAVTIPANGDCTIQTIKSIDDSLLAASGRSQRVVVRATPGVTGSPKSPVVKVTTVTKTIAEQISAFETTRVSKAAKMDAIMDAAAEKGETLDAAQKEEYEGLEVEVKAIDDHLVLLRRRETANKAAAVVIENVTDPASGTRARQGTTVPPTVRAMPTIPKGIGFTRFCMAVAGAKGNLTMAERMVEKNERWMAETPDVLDVIRSAVAAGTTTDSTWAGPLVQYQNLANEFIEYLRPLTLIGRLPGLRYVPFKVKIPRQTGTSTANWVGEGQAKPVSALSFDSVTMDIATISDIVIFTQQLARHSSPTAELLIRDDLGAKIVNFMDAQFIDPTVASTGSSPASVTNGVTPTVATGTTGDALRTDVGTLIEGFLEANLQLTSPVWVMSQVTAARINLIRNALGQKEYPELNVNGGMFEGIPAVTTQAVPATGGSPTDGYPIILMNAGDILIADDGQVRIDASSEASLQMDTAPDSPTTGSTTLVSLWQQGLMGLKADRDINWVKRRSTAVAYISSAKYVTG